MRTLKQKKKKVTHYNHIYIYNNKQQKVAIEFNFN
jgi:hypothetical protein